MSEPSFLGLVHNAALLLALVLVFDIVRHPFSEKNSPFQQFMIGLLLGGIGVCVMLTPWVLTPGVVFDTRSILLCISGLFFGAIPTLTAMLITGALRLSQGGSGAMTGTLVIIVTGTIGIAWRQIRRPALEAIKWKELYLLGLLTHLVMLALMLTLPWETAMRVLSGLTLPVLLIYPLGTALLGQMMSNRLRREKVTQELRQSEKQQRLTAADLQKSKEQYRLLTENIKDVVWILDVETMMFRYVSPSVERLRGYSVEEILAKPISDALTPEAVDDVYNLIRSRAADLLSGQTPSDTFYTNEVEQTCKDGGTVWTEVITSFYINPENNRVEVRGVTRDLTERKQMEAALRESEEKFRSIAEQTSDLIALTDTQGRITYVSTAANMLFKFTPEEMIGHHFNEFLDPSSISKAAAAFRYTQEYNIRTKDLELSMKRKDGSVFIGELNGSNFQYGGQPGSLSVIRDITERKQSEEAAKRNAARQNAMLSNIADVIAIIDQNAIVSYVSPNIENLFGWQPEDLLNDIGWKVVYPNDLERVQHQFYSLINQENSFTCIEFKYQHKDGSYHPIKLTAVNLIHNPDINGVLMNFHDITDSKLAEEALKQEKLLTDAILASVPGMLYLYDEQGYLLRWNKKHEEMTGYSAEELDHFYLLDWYTNEPEDIERVTKGVQKALTEGFATAEANLITKSGKKILFDFTAVRVDIGDQTYFTGIGIDITERRKAEQEIQAAQHELQRLLREAERSRQALLSVVEDQKEAEQLIRQLNNELEQRVRDRTALLTAANQELEAFSYSVSHDLRAPLRALSGFSSILIDEYADTLDEKGLHYLTRIHEAAQRMGQLINDLLNLSRITRSEFTRQSVNLSQMAQEIVNSLQIQAPQRQVVYKITPNMLAACDPNLMKIALENLLNNAYKFTSQRDQAVIEVGMQHQNGRPVFFVRDNGAGFNMDYANKLFAPFQRLHKTQEFPGSGIGLSIVQRIINRHGGQIWPEAEVDQGAAFYFTLEN
jgi:PAS domain S-box-containing protein